METNQLEVLAHIVLPSEILDYFSVVGIKQTSTETHIHLDGLINPALSLDVHFESKGFMEAVGITDFPIRNHKVLLRTRRRRQTDTRTGKSFSIPVNLDVACKGTRYSKGFDAFLKRRMGTSLVTCRTLEEFHHVDGHTFEKQYKETPGGFRNWNRSMRMNGFYSRRVPETIPPCASAPPPGTRFLDEQYVRLSRLLLLRQ